MSVEAAGPFQLTTARLRIRPWRDGDRPALAQMTGDGEMMRYVTAGRVWTSEQVDTFLHRQADHLGRYGVCFGAVELAEDGAIAGLAGFQPHDDGLFELGWWIWKDYWRRGLATEAALACVEHGRNVLGLSCLVAILDPDNSASRRVAEKIGMRFVDIRSARSTIATREDAPVAYFRMEL